MALQTKTFTWGSYKWKSESNAYVVELALTENAISEDGNTSEIGYKLTLKSGGSNRFEDRVGRSLKLNGKTVAQKDTSKYLDYNSSWELLSGTATVEHNADGTLTMPIEVTIDSDKHKNQYAPPDKTLTWSWELTSIPRASDISSAADVTLGNACDVRWTPNSSAFRYKLRFSLKDKDWSHTTDAIHPNKTSAYTYTGYEIPINVAEQITESNKGTMTVELITYSDSECKTEVGTKEKTFTVTVPSNEQTQPNVDMELEAESALDGLYIQGQAKVKATKLEATGKLGAAIKAYSYSITVDGVSYGSPYLSNALTKVGEVEITGRAVDTRGITGSVTQKIAVLPYYMPRLTGVAAYRCTSDGIAADNGEYLKIEATRDYAPVVVNGEQRNFCSIQYRYKEENEASYSDLQTILDANADSNSVVSGALLNATFSKTSAYTVQIIAVDTVGQSQTVTISIPSERVFRHKRAGGKGLGLGGMCQEDDLLDVHWNQRVRKDLQVDGSICGAYIRVAESKPDLNTLVLETAFEYAVGDKIQSIFALGSGWSDTWIISNVQGVVMSADGSGIGQLTNDEGGKTYLINLINNRENPMILISADPFEIIE